MVQPKYNPQEALERVKLMMKYDLSKTLNENKETMNEVAPLLALIPTTLPWLIGYGTAAATAIGTWIYNVQGGGDAFSKTQTFFAGCSSLDKNLKPLQSKGDHREAADSIYNAIEGIGTDLNAIKGAISSMESVADLCAMYKYYNKTYGDLYDDLDSDIDGESFRRYVWSAIAPIVDDAEENLEQAKKQEGGGGGSTSGYRDCQSEYTYGCKSPVIAKVQSCLGLTADGKFGPKTQKALIGKGMSSFKDSDVDKLCGNTSTPSATPTTQDEFTVQVDADNPQNLINP